MLFRSFKWHCHRLKSQLSAKNVNIPLYVPLYTFVYVGPEVYLLSQLKIVEVRFKLEMIKRLHLINN